MKLIKAKFYWENGQEHIIDGDEAEELHQSLNKQFQK